MLAETRDFGYNPLVMSWSNQRAGRSLWSTSPRLLAIFLAASLASLGVGCEQQKKGGATAEAEGEGEDAGTGPVIGGKLGEVVAAASASAPVASAVPEQQDGPPPTGIFAPGEADQKHALTAAPKVELLGEGAEPRVTLAMGKPKDGEKTQMVLQVRSGGQQGLPPVQLGLTTHIGGGKKKKDKAGKKDEGEASAADGITISVDKVAVAGQQDATASEQVNKVLSGLEGSKLRYRLTPTGGVGFAFSLPEKADPGLDMILRACQDIVSAMLVAPPKKAVGTGGYWMVTDRTTSLGVEVVRYRVFKVEQVLNGQARLSLEVRQYAANDKMNLSLGPQLQNASLAQYQAKGQGEVIFSSDRLLPPQAQMGLTIGAGMLPPGAQNAPAAQQQMAVLQLETAGQLVADLGKAGAVAPGGEAPKAPSAPAAPPVAPAPPAAPPAAP